jgi:hypothetical protein
MIETIDKLDETALRKPTFLGGEPITLADVQPWCFPKPCVVYRPRFGAPRVGGAKATDLGPDFDDAVAELDDLSREREPDEPRPERTFIDALFNLAAVMLRINYDLTDEMLSHLLEFRLDDEANQETWLAIVDVARGKAPKQTSDTTGSAT